MIQLRFYVLLSCYWAFTFGVVDFRSAFSRYEKKRLWETPTDDIMQVNSVCKSVRTGQVRRIQGTSYLYS
jgi:hypothetical protein